MKIYTKHPDSGGAYVYYSGTVNNIIWDVPENDIPFKDESGEQTIYIVLNNMSGVLTNFKIQLYVIKGW
jgi:hypothetical protein